MDVSFFLSFFLSVCLSQVAKPICKVQSRACSKNRTVAKPGPIRLGLLVFPCAWDEPSLEVEGKSTRQLPLVPCTSDEPTELARRALGNTYLGLLGRFR